MYSGGDPLQTPTPPKRTSKRTQNLPPSPLPAFPNTRECLALSKDILQNCPTLITDIQVRTSAHTTAKTTPEHTEYNSSIEFAGKSPSPDNPDISVRHRYRFSQITTVPRNSEEPPKIKRSIVQLSAGPDPLVRTLEFNTPPSPVYQETTSPTTPHSPHLSNTSHHSSQTSKHGTPQRISSSSPSPRAKSSANSTASQPASPTSHHSNKSRISDNPTHQSHSSSNSHLSRTHSTSSNASRSSSHNSISHLSAPPLLDPPYYHTDTLVPTSPSTSPSLIRPSNSAPDILHANEFTFKTDNNLTTDHPSLPQDTPLRDTHNTSTSSSPHCSHCNNSTSNVSSFSSDWDNCPFDDYRTYPNAYTTHRTSYPSTTNNTFRPKALPLNPPSPSNFSLHRHSTHTSHLPSSPARSHSSGAHHSQHSPSNYASNDNHQLSPVFTSRTPFNRPSTPTKSHLFTPNKRSDSFTSPLTRSTARQATPSTPVTHTRPSQATPPKPLLESSLAPALDTIIIDNMPSPPCPIYSDEFNQDPEVWLFQYQAYCSTLKMTPEAQFHAVPLHLGAHPLSWYLQLLKDPHKAPKSYADFKRAFLLRFASSKTKLVRRQAAHEETWDLKEPISTYVDRVEKNCIGMDDVTLLSTLTRGLPPEFRLDLHKNPPENIEQWMYRVYLLQKAYGNAAAATKITGVVANIEQPRSRPPNSANTSSSRSTPRPPDSFRQNRNYSNATPSSRQFINPNNSRPAWRQLPTSNLPHSAPQLQETRRCYNCNKIGHLSQHCRLPRRPRQNFQTNVYQPTPNHLPQSYDQPPAHHNYAPQAYYPYDQTPTYNRPPPRERYPPRNHTQGYPQQPLN